MQERQFGINRRHLIAGGTVATAAALSVRPLVAGETAGEAFVVGQGGLAWFDVVPGERMAIHVPNGRVGGHFTVVESIAAPGAGVPPHIHNGADEYFFVQEGTLHFRCGDTEFDAPAGTSVAIPRGIAHGWVNRTDAPARVVVTFTPGGIEEMFAKIAAAFPDGIEALAAQYDTVLVG